MPVFIAPTLALLFAVPPESGAPSAGLVYWRCTEKTSTNPEWAACGEAFLKRLDDELNVAWTKVNSSLDEKGQKELLDEQRAWLKFRDSSCLYWASGSYGREGQVLHFYGCRGAIIEARVSDLNVIYELMHQDAQ